MDYPDFLVYCRWVSLLPFGDFGVLTRLTLLLLASEFFNIVKY